jgi:hypothetical protein
MKMVSQSLMTLNQGMAEIDANIRNVCAELGLEAPV